jgi:Zn-dependent M28 family amino/carboxypeptidase
LELADAGKKLPTFALPGSIKAKVRFEQNEIESQNVVGLLPGADPKLKSEYVVLSAHLDHLGIGEPIHGDRIYNGAMDNASGVATILDVADSIHDSGKKPRRSLLFLAFTAEEKGLLGSRYFATHPTVKPESLVANVNIDMFLPLFPLKILNVLGLDDSDLGPMLRSVAESEGIKIQGDLEPDRNLFIRSDQYNFIRAGVPSIYFKVGYEPGSPEAATVKKWLTERYHAPSDDTHQPVDLGAAAEYNKVVILLADAIADRADRPRWNSDSFFRRYAR